MSNEFLCDCFIKGLPLQRMANIHYELPLLVLFVGLLLLCVMVSIWSIFLVLSCVSGYSDLCFVCYITCYGSLVVLLCVQVVGVGHSKTNKQIITLIKHVALETQGYVDRIARYRFLLTDQRVSICDLGGASYGHLTATDWHW